MSTRRTHLDNYVHHNSKAHNRISCRFKQLQTDIESRVEERNLIIERFPFGKMSHNEPETELIIQEGETQLERLVRMDSNERSSELFKSLKERL